jgi:hypothetical protein
MKTEIERIEEDMLTVLTEANEFLNEKLWTGEMTLKQGEEVGKYIRNHVTTGMNMLSVLQNYSNFAL